MSPEEGIQARARAAWDALDVVCPHDKTSAYLRGYECRDCVLAAFVALAEDERKAEREACAKAVCMFCDADDEPAVLHVDGQPKRFHRPRETWGWEECMADPIRSRSASDPAEPEKPTEWGPLCATCTHAESWHNMEPPTRCRNACHCRSYVPTHAIPDSRISNSPINGAEDSTGTQPGIARQEPGAQVQPLPAPPPMSRLKEALAREGEIVEAQTEPTPRCSWCDRKIPLDTLKPGRFHVMWDAAGVSHYPCVAVPAPEARVSPEPFVDIAGIAPDFTDGVESATYIKQRWERVNLDAPAPPPLCFCPEPCEVPGHMSEAERGLLKIFDEALSKMTPEEQDRAVERIKAIPVKRDSE